MRFLQQISTVAVPLRQRASWIGDHTAAFFSGEPISEPWIHGLSAAGVNVTPELALTLSAYYNAVTLISRELATVEKRVSKVRADGGSDWILPLSYARGNGGIVALAHVLCCKPNDFQTSPEFFMGQLAAWLMRGVAFAEIINGPAGFLAQLLPRHPDRVRQERLPNGRIRYALSEANGQTRYVTQEEMHVVRDLSIDGGLNSLSRTAYGAQSLGSALATQKAAGTFFKTGMTAALLATYTGEMEEEDEAALHKSISRYASGAEHSSGIMLVPDDVKVTNLAFDPEKAQMMLAQDWGVREVARLFNLPGSKLGIKDSVGYGNHVQDALNYVGSLRPIADIFEEAIGRDLILAPDTYSVEFWLDELLRGAPDAQASYFETLIRCRVMRPSEARVIIKLNPDPELDRLSAADFRPGGDATGGQGEGGSKPKRQTPIGDDAKAWMVRPMFRAMLAVHDNATRVVRRERAAVEKIAKKHPSDVEAWQAGLREFFADHASFVSQTMRISIETAREYAAQHGSALESHGVVVHTDDWERFEGDELAALALDTERSAA